jgi:hypothetical protein
MDLKTFRSSFWALELEMDRNQNETNAASIVEASGTVQLLLGVISNDHSRVLSKVLYLCSQSD